MPKAKRKQKYSINKLNNISQHLGELDKKQKSELNLRESIYYLRRKLNRALAQGYNYVELAKILEEQEIKISASTLKQYLADSTKNSSRKKNKIVSVVTTNSSIESDNYPPSKQDKNPSNKAAPAVSNDNPTSVNADKTIDKEIVKNINHSRYRSPVLSDMEDDLKNEFNQF